MNPTRNHPNQADSMAGNSRSFLTQAARVTMGGDLRIR